MWEKGKKERHNESLRHCFFPSSCFCPVIVCWPPMLAHMPCPSRDDARGDRRRGFWSLHETSFRQSFCYNRYFQLNFLLSVSVTSPVWSDCVVTVETCDAAIGHVAQTPPAWTSAVSTASSSSSSPASRHIWCRNVVYTNLRYSGKRPRLPFLLFAWHARTSIPTLCSRACSTIDPMVRHSAGAQHSLHRYKTITLFPHVTRQRPCAFCLLTRREKRHMILLWRVASWPPPHPRVSSSRAYVPFVRPWPQISLVICVAGLGVQGSFLSYLCFRPGRVIRGRGGGQNCTCAVRVFAWERSGSCARYGRSAHRDDLLTGCGRTAWAVWDIGLFRAIFTTGLRSRRSRRRSLVGQTLMGHSSLIPGWS